ncbi:ATP-binding protein [Vibrio lentus]|uniref:ATP-binding protein n=1 Tax=Vibrio lentus TaxID=136468 RepID=UPI000C816F2E|nr:ATP-binding protein [Vibrio lentus]PMI92268.1 hybrid sensor histidine kinase/response regulator [Vibrio lentus]PMJ06100.1 hybrid sensor histidine kinase/response regulator [Vibrio lentus]TKG19608.1 response regulator [Vibrio lentus]
MVLSFKNKLIFTNAIILTLFVTLLTYSAIELVRFSSQHEFEDIKSNITGHNRKLLLTFVKSQSVTLNKEVELLSEEVNHIAQKFTYEFYNGAIEQKIDHRMLANISTELRTNTSIDKVTFVDAKRNEEISIDKHGIVSNFISLDFSKMTAYKNFYVNKETDGRKITSFLIYVRLDNFDNSYLKFDVGLDYFSHSLAFENMVDELQYRYFLVDSGGKLLASNLKQNVGQFMSEDVFDNQYQTSVASYIMSGNLGSFVVSGKEGVFNVTFVKNHQTGWRLILVTPEHVIRSSYTTTEKLLLSSDNSLIEELFLAYTFFLCLFLTINSTVVNKMIKPIYKLIDQAQYLKERDFNKATYIVYSNGDEIEQLSKAYSEAGTQIKNLIEELEFKVEERTKQYEVAAQEASEANKQKSVLLSNVSHEIRTPLNAIIGFTHMLTYNKHSKAYNHHLNGISAASNTILGIVNDLLDFERVKTTNYSLTPKCLPVMSLVSEIENMFFPLSESKGLSFDIICNIEASTTLMIDELRIKQAISNIVSNAFKFTNRGGVRIEFFTDGEAFNILVSDTGVGIPKDKLDSVFNGFEQVNHEDQQFGFGLGLAITKTIVELMKGTIRVESELGTGSTFVISLPLDIMNVVERPFDVAEQTYRIGDGIEYTGKKALIVDDVEFNREILEFHLDALGFVCMTTNDGLDALELTSENDFDVVLTDISMPVMDGIELALELEKRKPSLPIIAVTARATIQEESRMNQHFSCYITKPLAPNDLKVALHCALSSGTC